MGVGTIAKKGRKHKHARFSIEILLKNAKCYFVKRGQLKRPIYHRKVLTSSDFTHRIKKLKQHSMTRRLAQR